MGKGLRAFIIELRKGGNPRGNSGVFLPVIWRGGAKITERGGKYGIGVHIYRGRGGWLDKYPHI